MNVGGVPRGHVFVSCDRVDSGHADRLCQVLEKAGFPVWRETADLLPGDDWRGETRQAVTRDAVVFLACFSRQSVSLARSEQNEQIILAVEEARLRPAERVWLIPVRFDDCEIPYRDLGGGRTLETLRQADLFGDEYDENASLLVEAIRQVAGGGPGPDLGWSLAADVEAGRHWRPRARGVAVDSERGFRFRGRARALTEIVAWLDRSVPDRKVLVVTGSPGAGKSAVLSRVITTADPMHVALLPADDQAVRATPGSVACAVHAKSKTALEVAGEIATAGSAREIRVAGDLPAVVRQALAGRAGARFNVVVDALDEAVSPEQAREFIADIVLPLAQTCSDLGVQVAVGTRQHDSEGSLLAELGRATTIINLDDPAYFAPEDLTAYALACLQLNGDERPDSPYADAAAALPVAARIADLSDRNFLIAGLVARDHGLNDPSAADAAGISFDATVGSALARYLRRIQPLDGLGVTASQALTALAFAEAPGVAAELWQLLIGCLYGKTVPVRYLTSFARSAAADFLIEQSGEDEPMFRLFHRALDDSLAAARARLASRSDDEHAIAAALIRLGHQHDWTGIPPYLLRSLPGHAAAGGLIDDLLTDDAYLLAAELGRLTLASQHAASAPARRSLQMIGLTPQAVSAGRGERAALFSVTQALEDMPARYRHNPDAPYLARWAHAQPLDAQIVLEGHQGPVMALCAIPADGNDLLASGGTDQTVRIWDPATLRQVHMMAGHQEQVNALCPVPVNGKTLVASAGYDATIRIWDPAAGSLVRIIDSHHGVRTLWQILADGRICLASGGSDGTIKLWDPDSGRQLACLTGHEYSVRALCPAGDGRIASGSADGTIRIWDIATGEQVFVMKGHEPWVTSVCLVTTPAGPALASAGSGRTIRIWDPATGTEITRIESRNGHIDSLCTISIGTAHCLAGAGGDEPIEIWDLATRQPVALISTGQRRHEALCAVDVHCRPMLASGGDDGPIRLWNPLRGASSNAGQTAAGFTATFAPQEILLELAGFPGHPARTDITLACPVLSGHRVLLAAAPYEGPIQILDPVTGSQLAAFGDRRAAATAICQLTMGDRSLIASTGYDRKIRIWNPATADEIGHIDTSPMLTSDMHAMTIGGEPRLIGVERQTGIRIWDPRSLTAVTDIRAREINAICVAELSGQDRLISATDDVVQIWDPATWDHADIPARHFPPITVMTSLTLHGRPVLATGAFSGSIMIYDLTSRVPVAGYVAHQGPVKAVIPVILSGQPVLASAGTDRTVRLWELNTFTCVMSIPVHHEALALAWLTDTLAIGLTAGVITIDLNASPTRSA